MSSTTLLFYGFRLERLLFKVTPSPYSASVKVQKRWSGVSKQAPLQRSHEDSFERMCRIDAHLVRIHWGSYYLLILPHHLPAKEPIWCDNDSSLWKPLSVINCFTDSLRHSVSQLRLRLKSPTLYPSFESIYFGQVSTLQPNNWPCDPRVIQKIYLLLLLYIYWPFTHNKHTDMGRRGGRVEVPTNMCQVLLLLIITRNWGPSGQ